MSTLLLECLAALIRWAITAVFGYLVVHHVIAPDAGDHFTTEFATHAVEIATLVGALGWSLWAKYRSRIKFLTALESPSGATEAGVNTKIERGMGAPLT